MKTLLLATTLLALNPSIERARRETGVPAVAVIAVDRSGVLYAQAFGLADMEKNVRATTDTPFYIASATKSFTGLAAAILLAEGKLDIDAPLKQVVPETKMDRVTLRDLLTHRLGFENNSITMRTAYSGEWDDAMIWRLLEQHTTTRARDFNYDNLGYVIAGYAIGSAGRGTWKSVIESRILQPLGMTHTSPHPIAGSAKPYLFVNDRWVAGPEKRESTMHAAGGMYASVNDLGRWIRVQLGGGTIDGRRLFPARAMRETQAPQIGMKQHFHRFERYSYGFGWFHSDFEGELLMHHFGGFSGAQAHVSFMPERGIGVAVVTNTHGMFAHLVASYVYDTLLKKSDAESRFEADVKKLVDNYSTSSKRFRERAENAAGELPANVLAESHPPAWYAGTYVDDGWGAIVVDDQLHVRYGVLSGQMTRVQGNAFVFGLIPGESELAYFRNNELHWNEQTFTRK